MDSSLPREKGLTKQHIIATEILLHLDLLGLSSFQKGTLIRQRVLFTNEDTDDERLYGYIYFVRPSARLRGPGSQRSEALRPSAPSRS